MGKVGKVKRRGESYSVFPTPFKVLLNNNNSMRLPFCFSISRKKTENDKETKDTLTNN